MLVLLFLSDVAIRVFVPVPFILAIADIICAGFAAGIVVVSVNQQVLFGKRTRCHVVSLSGHAVGKIKVVHGRSNHQQSQRYSQHQPTAWKTYQPMIRLAAGLFFGGFGMPWIFTS